MSALSGRDHAMAFYIRKAFRLGLLRLNLSKRGVGVSAGVKGARVGVDAAGREYAHAGRYGFYWRKHGRRVATSGGAIVGWLAVVALAGLALAALLMA